MSHQHSHEYSTIKVASRGAGDRVSKFDSDFLLLQDEVHRRLASELHDSTCQHLVAAGLIIMQVKRSLVDPQKAEELCDQIDSSVGLALKELRSLTYLLHPYNLNNKRVKSAIEEYGREYAARTSLTVDISISPEVDDLSYERQRSLMRIVQEALANVYRHAKATRVEIVITARKTYFDLRIRDNGQGMPIRRGVNDHSTGLRGNGLLIMKARLLEMGGALQILPVPKARGGGTILHATFPGGRAPEPRKRTVKRALQASL
jgi:signal transduction histidine kinase